MIHFVEPALLWLLLLLPVVVASAWQLRSVPRGRWWVMITLRCAIVILIIFALARAEIQRTAREIAVFFVVDVSDSIPTERRLESIDFISNTVRRATGETRTGVIVFGGEPSLETSPVRIFDFERRFFSRISTDTTDISAGLRLALAAFPRDTLRRIVLISDGNENVGSALDVARQARNAGVPIDVFPLRYDAERDVQIDRVIAPQRTIADAPFDVNVFVSSDTEAEGTLRLLRNDVVVAQERVRIRPGRNPPFAIQQRLTDTGFYVYTAIIDVDGDPRPQNNRGEAFTYLEGEPRILLVEGSERLADARFLVSALRLEGLQVDMITPAELPTGIAGLQEFDSIIFSNVPAGVFAGETLRALERAIHDFGVGFVMVGGENSFGAGGWTDTPIELALPLSLDVREQRMLPNGALVVILHTVEIPDGNAWAREVALASLNVLSAQDYFGLSFYGRNPQGGNFGFAFGDFWLWDPPLQLAGDKVMMRNLVRGVAPMDMPNYAPTMQMAYNELSRVRAQTKHIVIISDGDASPPTDRLVNQIRDAGITISTVCIAPHSMRDAEFMEVLAFRGGGNFYFPQNSEELPRIFTKEASVVRQSLLREETIPVIFNAPSEILAGIGALPPLDGLVVTLPKNLATLALVGEGEDPILAHWRYGLGKTVAFTSDAKDRWATGWLQSPDFAKFWSQAVRWSLRETGSGNLQIQTTVTGTIGRVVIDAIDEGGRFLNLLNLQGNLLGPDFEPIPLDVRQIAPGRYEAIFDAPSRGTYMISLRELDEEGSTAFFTTSGVSVSYSPEFQVNRSSEPFLARLAEASGGVVIDSPDYNPYLRNLPPLRAPTLIWPTLLFIAILLMPVDIFVRRVYVPWADLWVVLRRWLSLRSTVDTEQTAERLESLRAAKSRAAGKQTNEAEDAAAREAFRARLAKQQAAEDPAPSAVGEALRRRESKQTITPQDQPGKTVGDSGMDSLLEAKRRAQKKKGKGE